VRADRTCQPDRMIALASSRASEATGQLREIGCAFEDFEPPRSGAERDVIAAFIDVP